MSDNKLILTADDYGACEFINNGVDIALLKNCINSVATFVTYGKFSKESVVNLMNLQRAIENPFRIGLHFSITGGSPIIKKANSLAGFYSGNSLYFHSAENYKFNKVKDKDLRDELEAQIETMGEWLGGIDKIDSISSHHNVIYIDERLYDIFVDVVARYKIPIRSPLSWLKSVLNEEKIILTPIVFEGLRLGFYKRLGEISKSKLIKRQKTAIEKGLRMPYCLTDVFYGRPSMDLLDELFALNNNWKVTTEFMFHLGDPGMIAKEVKAPHGISQKYFRTRQAELAILTGMNLDALINEYAVQKITFKDLSTSDWLQPEPK